MVRRSWSKRGKRTVYQNQQEFSNRYMYSAIDPINGETFHLMDFDDAATNQTDTFIKALQERFFGEMRKFTANKIFTQGIQALSETVEKAVLKLCSNTEAIQRLTGYDWIMQQWKLVSEWMIVRCAC